MLCKETNIGNGIVERTLQSSASSSNAQNGRHIFEGTGIAE
jgi:hypothetical protein